MRHTTLIVPGFHGSGETHWQTWFERQLPNARRISGIDWELPRLADWSAAILAAIDAEPHPVWLVAHSFGCLASVTAAAQRTEKVAGALLVAPADPWRFTPSGLREWLPSTEQHRTIDVDLPQTPLRFNTVVAASSNDPWVKLTVAAYWAERWGSHFVNVGDAGHINTDAGFGPWPYGLALFKKMQTAQDDAPLGALNDLERDDLCACNSVKHHLSPIEQLKQDHLWCATLRQIV